MIYFSPHPSPIDDLLILSDGDHITGIYMNLHRHGPGLNPDWIRNDQSPVVHVAKGQLDAYFAGDLTEFDLPLKMTGTEFQSKVWEGLKTIPYGEHISYGEFARRLGVPNASRAVGLANGRNPISIVVPCHRVIGSNGKLVGYGGGLHRKEALLMLEAKVTGRLTTLF